MIKFKVIYWSGEIIYVDNIDVSMDLLENKEARMVERVEEW